MHRTSSFLNKGASIFGSTPTRPGTSSGSTATQTESIFSSTASRASSSYGHKYSKSSSRVPGARNVSTPIHSNKGSPESKKRSDSSSAHADNFPRPAIETVDSLGQVLANAEAANSPTSTIESFNSTTPYSNIMLSARPGTGYQNNPPPSFGSLQQPASPTLETITYQHIQETSSKRISTLDYLRKSQEGRVYWFNTLLFNKNDLVRMPYFEPRKSARRATNHLLLGISLSTIIDLNGSTALEFLKTLNALLSEFESFQSIHPPDGSSSLSRGRFPQMFKRATTTTKGRRTSSAAEIGLPMGNDYSDSKSSSVGGAGGSVSAGAAFAISENDLLPGEEYTHLLTPSLPFDPDFYETFATLCDVLIDSYTRLMSLVGSPKECNPVVAELFTKADARVRKIIVQGVVKEFEDSSRGGVKAEVAGVGRVVLGGLM